MWSEEIPAPERFKECIRISARKSYFCVGRVTFYSLPSLLIQRRLAN